MLLENTKNIEKLQLFSIIIPDLLSSESKFLPNESDYQASIKALEA